MEIPPLQRTTRVQIAIIENSQVILVQTHVKREDRYFWGLPGGGVEPGESERQAALRETREETNLEVGLLPFRLDGPEIGRTRIYRELITYLAYPISGEASTGVEPEPEVQDYFALTGLRWHNLYDDDGLDEFTITLLKPVRTLVDGPDFTRRAGCVVQRRINGERRFLLVTTRMNPHFWVFPQGKVDPGETPEEAACRETREESGMEVRILRPLGFQLSPGEPRPFRSDFYLAEWLQTHPMQEARYRGWFTLEEALSLQLHPSARRLLRELVL